jgi:hypothetical protein
VAFSLKDATTWVGGYDMTTDLNSLSLALSKDELPCAVFKDQAQRRTGGLEDVTAQLDGFWSGGDTAIDAQAFSQLSGGLWVATHSQDGAVGSVAYTYRAVTPNYQVGGKIGEVLPFSLKMDGAKGNAGRSAGGVRGLIAKPKGVVSATGATGTGQHLGAVASGQYLYAALHVFAVGTTISVKVQSDDNSGFTSATDVATLGPITTIGGTWMTRVAGPLTDSYYRLNVSAITGSATIAGIIGIK